MAKSTEKKEEKSGLTSSEQLGAILNNKDYKKDHYNGQKTVTWSISTGSILLDSAVGGSLTPCLLRLCGQNSEGKSSQALELMRNFLKTVPNSKGFWMIAEGRGLSKENRERCGLKFVYSAEEWVVGTVFVLESNVFELFIKCCKDLVMENEEDIRYCFVIDSVDGLQLRDDRAKDITENNKVAGVPAISKRMFQSLALGMFKYGHFMILISQVTAEIKLDPYAKTPNRGGNFSGGNTLLHASDWIFEFQKANQNDYILDKPSGKMNDGTAKTIGKWAKVRLVKSAIETSQGLTVRYPIKFGRKPSGVWLEREVIDSLLAMGLLEKGGVWFNFEASLLQELQDKVSKGVESKFWGEEKLLKYLESNSQLVEFLFKKVVHFSSLLRGNNERPNLEAPKETAAKEVAS